jgi:hypothetical protein
MSTAPGSTQINLFGAARTAVETDPGWRHIGGSACVNQEMD